MIKMRIHRALTLILSILFICQNALGQTEELIPANRLIKDFEVAVEMFEAHPDPYTYIPEEIFKQKVDSVKNTLDEPLSVIDFYKKIAYVVALIKDGHSSVQLPQTWTNTTNKAEGCFPYEMYLSTENQLYILKALKEGELKPGYKIVSIEGVSVDSFLARVDPYISYEKTAFRNTIIDDDFQTYLHLAFGRSNELSFMYYSTDTFETVVKNMPCEQRDDVQKQEKTEREELIRKGEPYAYKNLGKGIGLLNIYGFMADDLDTYNRFLHRTFKGIANDSIHSLIIDIRGNYGGWPKIASELFHYIYNGHFKTMARSDTKVSYAYKRHFYTMYPSLRENKPIFTDVTHYVDLHSILTQEEGSFIHESIAYNEKPINKPFKFNGDVYLLTNRDSYSAASSFASTFQCYNMGLIIGEETGGTKIFRGNPIYITLKRSGILVSMATSKEYTACATEDFMGVLPNVEYTPSIIQLSSEIDTQLHYAFRVIKEVRKQRERSSKTVAD